MYAGSGFQLSELGDVDIIRFKDEYHLFHLVLPNHDYIAHAVSKNGFVWRRVQNALFISDPGSWDDDMLWTMQVTPDPDNTGHWRMFYTGISRREHGAVQRIGLARSQDLYNWKKDTSGAYPIVLRNTLYETNTTQGRHWVSFRDPFFYMEDGIRLLLANARVADGPVIRRGCVALLEETVTDKFECHRPLFFPQMYDDIEVPGLYKIKNHYYLLGSLREDIKVHYWHSDKIFGPYRAFYDNQLLPHGNYAARITKVSEERYLVWSFYMNNEAKERNRLLPPPKELIIDADGSLLLYSYKVIDDRVCRVVPISELLPIIRFWENPSGMYNTSGDRFTIGTVSGNEVFLIQGSYMNFRLRCAVSIVELGKFGLCFRLAQDGNGYFISLDLINGIAQIRSWGETLDEYQRSTFHYNNMQINNFPPNGKQPFQLEIVALGGYIEFSINQRIILSLIDTLYMHSAPVGFYMESAVITIDNLSLEELDGPEDEEYGPV